MRISISTNTQGTYSSVVPDAVSNLLLQSLQKEIPLTTLSKDLHCTVMYSRTVLPSTLNQRLNDFSAFEYESHIQEINWWAGHDGLGYIVATLGSHSLETEHKRLITLGLVSTFEPYVPHITLANCKQSPHDKTWYKLLRLIVRRNQYNIKLNHQSIEPLEE